MVNSLIALRWVGEWAPSALFYAERLIYLPQGILATALGTVLLPVLSDFATQKKHDEMRAAIHHGLRTLLFVMVPPSDRPVRAGRPRRADAVRARVVRSQEHVAHGPRAVVLCAGPDGVLPRQGLRARLLRPARHAHPRQDRPVRRDAQLHAERDLRADLAGILETRRPGVLDRDLRGLQRPGARRSSCAGGWARSASAAFSAGCTARWARRERWRRWRSSPSGR